MRNHLILTVIYFLVLAPACKPRRDRNLGDSRLADNSAEDFRDFQTTISSSNLSNVWDSQLETLNQTLGIYNVYSVNESEILTPLSDDQIRTLNIATPLLKNENSIHTRYILQHSNPLTKSILSIKLNLSQTKGAFDIHFKEYFGSPKYSGSLKGISLSDVHNNNFLKQGAVFSLPYKNKTRTSLLKGIHQNGQSFNSFYQNYLSRLARRAIVQKEQQAKAQSKAQQELQQNIHGAILGLTLAFGVFAIIKAVQYYSVTGEAAFRHADDALRMTSFGSSLRVQPKFPYISIALFFVGLFVFFIYQFRNKIYSGWKSIQMTNARTCPSMKGPRQQYEFAYYAKNASQFERSSCLFNAIHGISPSSARKIIQENIIGQHKYPENLSDFQKIMQLYSEKLNTDIVPTTTKAYIDYNALIYQ